MSREALVARVISGGESGVDRAAVDVAIERGVPYGGWVPRGGWAEDFPEPPGLLVHYDKFAETEGDDIVERTQRNVRDTDATVIFTPSLAVSAGTLETLNFAQQLNRPVTVLDPGEEICGQRLVGFLRSIGRGLNVNVAGPRESEARGIYGSVYRVLTDSATLLFEGNQ